MAARWRVIRTPARRSAVVSFSVRRSICVIASFSRKIALFGKLQLQMICI
jgi:hypothetical protein